MNIISPGTHPVADKFWKEILHEKPNGARTLGAAQAKHLADLFEPYYDLMVCYASEYDFDIPKGTKRIAIMTHQNFPWTAGFKSWQRVNNKLKGYEVDYFMNEPKLIGLVREVGGRAFYLPRFIDTNEYPKIVGETQIPTLWFGNAWGEFQGEFEMYKQQKEPYWITQGRFGCGEEVIKDNLDRSTTLTILASAKKVWAIGICQLEARYYGAEVVSYRGELLPYYDEKTIRPYTKRLLKDVRSQ